MPAYRKTGAVLNGLIGPFKLDPILSSTVALLTGAANGANVVFKAYVGINESRYGSEVDMIDPADVATPINSLTGVAKAASFSAAGYTHVWFIRTDADASTAAELLISITVH